MCEMFSSVMNFMAVGYPTFPMEPPWLLVIWNNCVFSCIIFGMVGVWLAMNGSIAATSASTKILTQAVRPPVASLLEISEAMRAQEEYEALPKNFVQVPSVLQDGELPAHDRVHQNISSLRRAASVPAIRKTRSTPVTKEMEVLRWVDETAHATEGVVKRLHTEDDGGPGRSAALYSHFWMLRRVQRGYACFDAYARISLAVSAQQLVLVESYFALGHFMLKSEGWPSPVQNTEGAWLALLMGVYACWILFKLDLYMKKEQRRLVQLGLWLAPMLAALATQLFNIRTKHGEGGVRPCDQIVPVWLPWIVALLACSCHMLWILIILFVSRPLLANMELPVSFRAAIYLDIFGWHSRHFRASVVENHQGPLAHWDVRGAHDAHGAHDGETSFLPMSPGGDQQRRAFATFTEAKRLSRTLSKLSRPESAKHFAPEDKASVEHMKTVLDEELKDLQSQLSMPWSRQTSEGWSRQSSPMGSSWLQSACDDGSGSLVPYWVDCRSGQVVWSRPDGMILDLVRITESVQELLDRINSSEDVTGPMVDAEALPFELMPITPESEMSSSILPWKSLQRVCLAQLLVWLGSILVVLFDPMYYDTPIAPRELYNPFVLRKLNVNWPHRHFRPSAMTCGTNDATVYVGDQFAIWSGELYWDQEAVELYDADVHSLRGRRHLRRHERLADVEKRPLKLQNVTLHPVIPAIELEAAWIGFGILRRKGKVLMLHQETHNLTEQSIYPWIPGKKTWRLGPALPSRNLVALQLLEGSDAVVCSQRKGFVDMGWAVLAATDSGQVIVLCPTLEDELHPVEMLISLRHRKIAESVVSIVDSHTGSNSPRHRKIIGVDLDPEMEILWIFSQTSDGGGDLRLVDQRTARVVDVWPLPSGRWWAPGFCNLGFTQGFVLAGAADLKASRGGPELWRFMPFATQKFRKWAKETGRSPS
ncbi:unnamed protein product [Durusdinium trenchii]|uniref:Uncharacterized protein n=1 Tax=Durusdinium trenchii TaxID=1381693 RepID=A0ABP0N8Y4_9DINO